MWFFMLLVLVSFYILITPSVCPDDIKLLGVCSCVASFWESAAYSVNRIVHCVLYVYL